MTPNWREPWDGVSWRSTACLVIIFLLNGMLAPFCLLGAAGSDEPATAQFAAMTGILTIIAMLTRAHGRISTALRLAAVLANAGVLAVAVVAWHNVATLDHQLLPSWDLTLIGVTARPTS